MLAAGGVTCACRWEAGQRLYMKLLLQLYSAAAGAASSVPLAERCAAAGGVPGELVAAFRAVLEDGKLDGSFKVRGVVVCVCVCGGGHAALQHR